MKVFISTMWDLYFYWKFDCKITMYPGEFSEEIKKHLGFLFNEDEEIPDLTEAIQELYKYRFCIEDYYQCENKKRFVEKYSDK